MRIYLREQDFGLAIEIFDELAATSDKEFKAFGLAGKCVAKSAQKEYAASAEIVEQFWPYREYLLDSQMKKLLRAAIDKNRENLGRTDCPPMGRVDERSVRAGWLRQGFVRM